MNGEPMAGVLKYQIKVNLQMIQSKISELDQYMENMKEICTNRELYGELLRLETDLENTYMCADYIIEEIKEGGF